jgi:hypothetical protein
MTRRFVRILKQLLLVVALVAVPLAGLTGVAHASDVIQQVPLTDKVIEGFIAAQKDMAKISEKMQGTASDKPDPKIQAELEATAKQHGFKDFAHYDDVAANISMVMAGIDPQTGAFTDPVEAIKKEIEEVKADKSIPEKDKKQMLTELDEVLKVTQPIKFPANIELVKKYRQKIDSVLQ